MNQLRTRERGASVPTGTGVPPRRGVARPRLSRDTLIQYLVFAALVVFIVGPLIPVVYQSLVAGPLYRADGVLTLDNFTNLLADPEFHAVIGNSLSLAALCTLLTLVIAVPTAVLVVRSRMPFGRSLALGLQWPFFVSPLVLALGWIIVYGPAGFVSIQVKQLIGFVPWELYSIPGMALTQAVAFAPIAYVFCANALRQADSSLENAARVSGAGPLRVVFHVILPMLRPPIAYAALLTFTASLESLSIPLIFGTPARVQVFATYLYAKGLDSVNPDYGALGAASVLVLALMILLTFVQARLLRKGQRFVSVRGKAARVTKLDLGWIGRAGAVLVMAYLIFGAAIPLLGLLARSFTTILTPLANPLNFVTLGNYADVLTVPSYSRSILNSVLVALGCAVLVAVLALLVVAVARRSTFRFRRLAEYLAFGPQAVPGIIAGIGFFWAVSIAPGLGWLYGTLAIVTLAFAYGSFPSAYSSVASGSSQISLDLDNAGRVSGSDWVGVVRRLLGRLLWPSVLGAALMGFVIGMKAYSAALFVSSADTAVIGTTMLVLWTQGATGSVAALSVVQIVITAAFAATLALLMRGQRVAKH